MEINRITPEQLNKRLTKDKELFLLDVRSEDKYSEYHMDGANHLPKTIIFEAETSNKPINSLIPKDKEIIITCTTGNSAMKCAKILAERKYHVTVLDGGINAWKDFKNL
ncbi:rhodanese-like domain-containing protein [Heyndrickxia sporothermodurans]